MFRIKNRNLRFIDEPIGEEVGGGAVADAPVETDNIDDIDFSQFGVVPEAPDTPSEPPAQTKEPEMWAPVLSALPDDATRAMIRPHLQEWEKNTTQRFQEIRKEYEPYKRFKEQGVAPEQLEAGYGLMQQIDANPVQFMERMKSALTQAGLIQEAQQVQDAIDTEKETVEGEVDPIEELRNQQQQFFEAIEQQRIAEQQREIARQADQQTDADLAALESKYGTLSAPLKKQVFQQAILMNQQQNRFVPLEEAFKEVQQFIAYSRQVSPGRRAPQVIPPGGGLPAQQSKPVGQMTDAERKAAAAAVVLRIREENS